MALEYTVEKPKDLTKINSNDMGELLWWSYILNTTLEKLLTTIDKVGNSTELVRKAIASQST